MRGGSAVGSSLSVQSSKARGRGKCSEHSAQRRFFFYCFHKRYLEKLPADARESVMDIVTEFSKMENGVSLYLQDGTCVPEKDGPIGIWRISSLWNTG